MFVGSALTPRTAPLCCAPATAYPLSPGTSAHYSPLHKSDAAVILVFKLFSVQTLVGDPMTQSASLPNEVTQLSPAEVKTYVLDTNVLLHDPTAIAAFAD